MDLVFSSSYHVHEVDFHKDMPMDYVITRAFECQLHGCLCSENPYSSYSMDVLAETWRIELILKPRSPARLLISNPLSHFV